MPEYRIDTFDGETWCRDETGQQLDSHAKARQAALEALPDMVRDRLNGDDRRNFVVDVRDASGRLVYTATLALTGRYLS